MGKVRENFLGFFLKINILWSSRRWEEKQDPALDWDWDGRGIFLCPESLRKVRKWGSNSQLPAALPDSQPSPKCFVFLLLEKEKWRDGCQIIGGLSLKSQIIPVGQEMKLGVIQCWEDEEIRPWFQNSVRPSGSRKRTLRRSWSTKRIRILLDEPNPGWRRSWRKGWSRSQGFYVHFFRDFMFIYRIFTLIFRIFIVIFRTFMVIFRTLMCISRILKCIFRSPPLKPDQSGFFFFFSFGKVEKEK